MAISIAVSVTGSPSEQDVRAARLAVEAENQKRESAGEALLPLSNVAELASSYEFLLGKLATTYHESLVRKQSDKSLREQAASLWENASDAQRQAALTALGG